MSIDYRQQLGFDPQKGRNYVFPTEQIDAALQDKLERYAQGEITHAPIDERLQAYLDKLLGDKTTRLPASTIEVEHFGLARVLALPPGKDEYVNDLVGSYRLRQGVLHNPKNDKRTTKGVFHVAEGGLPIAADKKAVPLIAFAGLLK